MRALEAAADWLRPFVDTRTWDFCIVWRLADDPSSGGAQVKVESDEHNLGSKCRDSRRPHPVRTKACEALGHFPVAFSLYVGIHREAVISNQARWLFHGSCSASTSSHELLGTQVVIPVLGGLIEFFSWKQIHEDQNMVELVMAQFNGLLEPQDMAPQSYADFSLSQQHSIPMLEKSLNLPGPLLLSSLIPRMQLHYNIHPSLDGLSSDCEAPNETPFSSTSAYNYHDENAGQLIGNYCSSKRIRSSEAVSNQEACFALNCKRKGTKNDPRNTQLQGKRGFHSKNLITERNRRNKIKDGLFALRALVPKISKMDKAAILADAVDYIVELEKEKKRLQYELKYVEHEDCKKNNAGSEITVSDAEQNSSKSSGEQNQNLSGIGTGGTGFEREIKVCVEVNQITESKFLIEFFCEYKRGGFVRLMQAIDSLDLQVVGANVITFEGKVRNSLKVEANKNDISPRKLRDSLIELTR